MKSFYLYCVLMLSSLWITAQNIQYTDIPSNQHFFARDLATNQADFKIAGLVADTSTYSAIRLKYYVDDVLVETFDAELTYENNIASFSFDVTLEAGLTFYALEILGVKENNQEVFELKLDNLLVGDVYVINGQSNAEALAAIAPEDLDPFFRSYIVGLGWVRINQTFPGLWGGRLGKSIIDNEQMPVALFNQAEGAKTITDYYRVDSSLTNENNYGKLYERLEAAGVKDNIRATIWFQGEADGWGMSTETYKEHFTTIYNAWVEDYNIEKCYIFQLRPESCGHPFPYILEAQRQLNYELDKVTTISTTNANHDGCHFFYEDGYETLGNRLYQQVANDLYARDLPNTLSPDIEKAYLKDSVTLVLELTNTDSLAIIGTPWNDFKLESSDILFTGGATFNNELYLSLSAPLLDTTDIKLTYLAAPGNEPNAIINPTGVGLLCFYNFALSPPPVLSSLTNSLTKTWSITAYYPNPMTKDLLINLYAKQNTSALISIYGVDGRFLHRQSYPLLSGDNHITLPTHGYHAGLYYFIVQDNNFLETSPFIKF